MDGFISRKRRRIETCDTTEDDTDFKLALLTSLHPAIHHSTLLEALLASDGDVEQASQSLTPSSALPSRKRASHQASLSSYRLAPGQSRAPAKKPLVRKGKTLYLYAAEDIEAHTPCSIIHNFLPPEQANALLTELVAEAPSYSSLQFKLFDRVVSSPHTFQFYVNSLEEIQTQKTQYIYDGRRVSDVRQSLPEMLKACPQVEDAVNREIQRRIKDFYPNGQKLRYQSPKPWKANTAFVNCYDGPKESVGYHADQLTYLGPRAVIGSLSLGVAREFRVRKILPREDEPPRKDVSAADAQGQISIHLPHNSLLIMHAEMQEEWKHSIAPQQTVDPHPLAGNKRLNITYRHYKDALHPNFTPKCKCGVPAVLRCVTKQKENRGRYMWMCHAHYVPEEKGCSFFQWAEFDDDGEPPWAMHGTQS